MPPEPTAEFRIVEGYERIAPYLDALQAAADLNRDALGFFPASVYAEFARDSSLYVLEMRHAGRASYAGHLLFSCRYPRADIRQIFVLSEHRRSGHAEGLLQHLESSLVRQSFTSIRARVAEDLMAANVFWERRKFYVQRAERGGEARNRRILVRIRELPSPQLFPPSGISSDDPLGLSSSVSNDIPLFLIDLNVLFDVMPRRLRHAQATSLFQAERVNACRLAISDEIRKELSRTAGDGRTDPMEAYVQTFPSFPLSENADSRDLLSELGTLIFPSGIETEADKSDLRHLATAIEHDLAGFVTSDESILAASASIRKQYGVHIISPAAFCMDASTTSESDTFQIAPDATIEIGPVSTNHDRDIQALLSKVGLSGSSIAAVWCPPEIRAQGTPRVAVWSAGTPIGYVTWSIRAPGSEATIARAALDESDLQAAVAGRILLLHLLEQLISSGPRHVSLELPTRQAVLRELAFGFGFRGVSGQPHLAKIVAGRVLTMATWTSIRNDLAAKGGPKLPTAIPTFHSIDQQISVLTPSGNQAHIPLEALETLLSPALLCLPGRSAVITPIQRRFSEALLGHPKQDGLLPQSSASSYQNRHYLASPRSLNYFKRGSLMFFYESTKHAGRAELVAVARVRQAYVKAIASIGPDLAQSVLTESSLSEIGSSDEKTVVSFDNLFHLPNGVPLSSLKRMGFGRPNDLITTRSINDTQTQEILKEAFGNG